MSGKEAVNRQILPLSNGDVLALGRMLSRIIPDNWLDPLGYVRHIGDSLIQALEGKEPGLSARFHDYLLRRGETDLPEFLAELFVAAERKVKWEECGLCSGTGYKWKIFRLLGVHCGHCKGKGGWVWFPNDGIDEEEAVPRLLPIHQPIAQEKERKIRLPGW